MINSKILYLFVDESGNFDFTPKGTKYFVLTCLSTTNPVVNRSKLIKLRYKLLVNGENQEYFHATEDSQSIRDEVFKIISSTNDDFAIDAIVVEKNKTNPALYIEKYIKRGKQIKRVVGSILYQKISATLLKYVFNRPDKEKFGKIVVILGSIFTKDKQQLILKSLKTNQKLKNSIPFEIYFHQAKVDLNCQLADYCGWAIFIKYEREEKRSKNLIKDKIKSEFRIFHHGNNRYYRYK